jgi:hypothetical protein
MVPKPTCPTICHLASGVCPLAEYLTWLMGYGTQLRPPIGAIGIGHQPAPDRIEPRNYPQFLFTR